MKRIFKKIISRILPSCEEVSHLTSQAMDESLSWKESLQLRMHLRICIWCRNNAKQLKQMQNLAHQQAAVQNEQAKLGSDARERIAKLIDQNNKQ